MKRNTLLSIAILITATINVGVVIEVQGGLPAPAPVCSLS